MGTGKHTSIPPRIFLTPKDDGDESSADELDTQCWKMKLSMPPPIEEEGEESPGSDEIFCNISSKLLEISLSLEPDPKPQPQWEPEPGPDMDSDRQTDSTEYIINAAGPMFGSHPRMRTPLLGDDSTPSDSTLPSEKETGKRKSIAPRASPVSAPYMDREEEEEKEWRNSESDQGYHGEEVEVGQEVENPGREEDDAPDGWDDFSAWIS